MLASLIPMTAVPLLNPNCTFIWLIAGAISPMWEVLIYPTQKYKSYSRYG
ncbi:hypothetical protein VAE151_500310 [Vibrio aestuarianus]|uniref:Uncharacterized protein n=1 Tax=Vibrio aestuarianus TaxID=28171 RepID=A0ABM9FM98_9VIBR|nr:hypothetical protein VAE032_220311 [Vibrio aestuarianus]CAH8184367.1 hypothetical protein VAE055_320311 [Vibrio aestuarianus]CAH8184457.1 hypothetical protein VAE128_420311 [Vibrio aestuarianus]CAH8184485.1 hypothetical protein VAE130_530309 [Vibrio aestuarianus]CAH8184577.1 hypothetical protein VAE115_270312 [Vibrio aestuarianus]